MLTVQKMYDDLDYWIHIGIGDDIITLPDQRKEYQHLVRKFHFSEDHKIVQAAVLESLRQQLQKPWYMRTTFWVLLMLWAKSKVVGK